MVSDPDDLPLLPIVEDRNRAQSYWVAFLPHLHTIPPTRPLKQEGIDSMCEKTQIQGSLIDVAELPDQYPTQFHEPTFWEQLGRTVATFGFLEEVLGKAIFSFTATREYADDEIDSALREWLPILEKAVTNPLGNLIDTFGKAVRENPKATIENLDDLLEDLRKASSLRNVLCHGSWREPDEEGSSIPFFINRQKEVFETAVDILFLQQTQRHVAELACAVINTVTHMGWQFPGSKSPGHSIMG